MLHNAGFLAQKRLARGLCLNHPEAVALIHRRTASQQGVRGRRTAIQLQRAELGVDGCGVAADLIRVNAVSETGAAIADADEIKSLRSEIAGEVGAKAIKTKYWTGATIANQTNGVERDQSVSDLHLRAIAGIQQSATGTTVSATAGGKFTGRSAPAAAAASVPSQCASIHGY